MKKRSLTSRMLFVVTFMALAAPPAWSVDTLYDQRFKRWNEEAEQGDSNAQYNLGNAYLRGTEVARDLDKAAEWFEKAAEQGYHRAQYKLGYLYYTGTGVKRSYRNAFRWLRKSAEQDYSPAQFYLGKMYADGKGVDRDYQKALRWLKAAENQRYTPAADEIAKVETALAAQRRARAERRAQAERRAAEQARREAERRAQRLAEERAERRAARQRAENKPKPQPEPPEKSVQKEDKAPAEQAATQKPESYDTRELLLRGGILTAKNEPATNMPSTYNSCEENGGEIVCKTQRLTENNEYAQIYYKVESRFSNFTPSGRFVASHRKNVLLILPENPDDPTPLPKDEVPDMGWGLAKVMKCKFEDTDHIACINDDFQRRRFVRK